MKKLFILILAFLPLYLSASDRSDIYKAFITGDIKQWKSVIDRMNREKTNNPETRAELLNYQYGYIGWCIGIKDYPEAKKYLSLAESNLEFLSANRLSRARVKAYKAAFTGYRIAMNNMLAPVLGFKSIEYAGEAAALDPSDPFVWIQNGNVEFYWPKVLGGSKKEALDHFTKALDLMEKDPSSLKENWLYINLLLLISQTYTYLDDYVSSKIYLERILKIAPDFAWVKNSKYPRIEVKSK